MDFWDGNGAFASFTKKLPLPFKASELEEHSMYRALDNFGFILVIALDGPSGSGWSSFVSPESELIDMAEKVIKK